MRSLCLFILFLMILPFPLMGEDINMVGESYLDDLQSNEYKKFLKEMRKTDIKRVFVDYKEDRDTRYRKLRESIIFESQKAALFSNILWEERYAERWDRQQQLIEKVYSGSSFESDRASRALIYGYPSGRRGKSSY